MEATYIVEKGHTSEVIVAKKKRPYYRYEIFNSKEECIGFLQTLDKGFIEYLYGMGCNIRLNAVENVK